MIMSVRGMSAGCSRRRGLNHGVGSIARASQANICSSDLTVLWCHSKLGSHRHSMLQLSTQPSFCTTAIKMTMLERELEMLSREATELDRLLESKPPQEFSDNVLQSRSRDSRRMSYTRRGRETKVGSNKVEWPCSNGHPGSASSKHFPLFTKQPWNTTSAATSNMAHSPSRELRRLLHTPSQEPYDEIYDLTFTSTKYHNTTESWNPPHLLHIDSLSRRQFASS
ncbi:hypothetical protein DOTSEDRAFT_74426 [Dothistroma septosporum NZE10]|uniref:Uncharacterized protein n=1 Tax=Dothistroma septosporum (strain NZE10 / CBS 128990) TaxID=675120 RepID=N1PFI1_DOTSN|nr:hypothetical protein DOTSEDRAFT_74426 [Dothistroma septosporum NZE10]